MTGSDKDSKTSYIKQITEQNNRITKARELLLAGDIDGSDYKTIKVEAEKTIMRLEAKLTDILILSNMMSIAEVEEMLDRQLLNPYIYI